MFFKVALNARLARYQDISTKRMVVSLLMIAIALLLVGCPDDGRDGRDGRDGEDGIPGASGVGTRRVVNSRIEMEADQSFFSTPGQGIQVDSLSPLDMPLVMIYVHYADGWGPLWISNGDGDHMSSFWVEENAIRVKIWDSNFGGNFFHRELKIVIIE